jgi:G:T-mismatch repair DNA endonuclease (very short patch repair protein)
MNIEIIYKTLINDSSILSLSQLAKLFGYGSKKRLKMANSLYEKYTKEHILSITRSRLASHAAREQWKTRPRNMSEDTKIKISESNKKIWEMDDGTRREISRKNIIKNSANVDKKKAAQKAIETRRKRDKWAEYSPESYKSMIDKNKNKIISDETRKKQSISAKKRGRTLPIGFKHSEDTLKVLAENAKSMWDSGKFKRIYRSKTSMKLVNELKLLGYNVECEYFISGRPFDIKINDCIIEFNGTYWHYDPRKYDKHFYDEHRGVYAQEIWNRDEEKLSLAKSAGFRTYVVWQSDWESTPEEVLKNVRRFIEGI